MNMETSASLPDRLAQAYAYIRAKNAGAAFEVYELAELTGISKGAAMKIIRSGLADGTIRGRRGLYQLYPRFLPEPVPPAEPRHQQYLLDLFPSPG